MRAIIAVLDSFGIGAAADAARFGDSGANTFGHILEACAAGQADKPELRAGPLRVPNLLALGLGQAGRAAAGADLPLEPVPRPQGKYGYAAELSRGKDTPSGHWEMMGLPVEFDWGYFPRAVPAFPESLIEALVAQAGIPGVLGNCHASGTAIIEELGVAHMRTGMPIVYTSADSVFQIAAHEETFGLERLYAVCRIARRLVDDYRIGRVIARPFVGKGPGTFRRTANRKDLATPPHGPTLLDIHKASGGEVIAIGKIGDIFAHKGMTREVKAAGNGEIFDALLREMETAPDKAVIFANFVDFDTLYGHRRDVPGYAAALESFDRRLPELYRQLRSNDIAVLTADHGCDPTWTGTDHTREFVPVLAFGPRVKPGDIGRRDTFADIGQSLAAAFGHAPLKAGTSFLETPRRAGRMRGKIA